MFNWKKGTYLSEPGALGTLTIGCSDLKLDKSWDWVIWESSSSLVPNKSSFGCTVFLLILFLFWACWLPRRILLEAKKSISYVMLGIFDYLKDLKLLVNRWRRTARIIRTWFWITKITGKTGNHIVFIIQSLICV